MVSSVLCLAFAIYFEAGNQDLKGKLAVGQVVLNRVESGRYPNNTCDVVKQNRQFSFYSDGKPERLPIEADKQEYKVWNESYQIASFLLSEGSSGDHVVDSTNGAMHYHAYYVSPKWVNDQKVKIGDHLFYSQID